MSASPEFYKPAAPAVFNSPCASPLQAPGFVGFGAAAAADDDYYSCRTPTSSGITYLKEPTTCPPAPRKPPPPPLCKKRLFHHHQQQELISVRLDELERIFRPRHQPKSSPTRRRSLRHKNQIHHPPTAQNTTTTILDTN